MKRAKLTFTIHVIFAILLYINLLLGLIHEWLPFLSTHIWILWFLSHVIFYSIYCILLDFIFNVQRIVKQHLLYQSLLIILWYYQRIYMLNYQNVQNYELGCKRDLLIVTSTVTFTLLLLSFFAVFTRLIA